MKTPPRRFIVEFKSSRRQQKGRTNSIWGETDFKALTREVEEIAPHLFNSTEPTVPSDADHPPINSNAGLAVQDTDEQKERAVLASTEDAVESSELDDPTRSAEDAVFQPQEISPPRTGPEGGVSRKSPKHIPMDVGEDKTRQANNVESPIPMDELDALDLENKRLKRLLTERLRVQNLQLKKMLERFDVP
ncbi:hypothetical protein QN219_32875 [Sinorhizobium sp. 7-81]|uniref:hypothetical protein n=1 Tax=Sinorhizobium sp. 8-89 TaxID=3049089 RepID=UPI0024C3D860|nr:hypothetical protein [Sinorhizobium sp. 8-89]MDK1494708.1 hypothetical protein [Sinorhizobium sp. 8-89]